MTKTLSPKLALKKKRNEAIVSEFMYRKDKDMTMGIVADIKFKIEQSGSKISVSTIMRILTLGNCFSNKNENKFGN